MLNVGGVVLLLIYREQSQMSTDYSRGVEHVIGIGVLGGVGPKGGRQGVVSVKSAPISCEKVGIPAWIKVQSCSRSAELTVEEG